MWSDEFLLGNRIIDKQHQHLFAVASDLLKNYWNKDEVDKKALVPTINFLKEYTINHFADEEKFQIAAKYKDYEEHKKQHENLLNQLLHHEMALMDSDFAKEEVDAFIATLITWLTYHVAIEDKKITQKKFMWIFE